MFTHIPTFLPLLCLKFNTDKIFQLSFEIALKLQVLKCIWYTANSQQMFVKLGFIYIRSLYIRKCTLLIMFG